jgi:hypothetical protein
MTQTVRWQPVVNIVLLSGVPASAAGRDAAPLPPFGDSMASLLKVARASGLLRAAASAPQCAQARLSLAPRHQPFFIKYLLSPIHVDLGGGLVEVGFTIATAAEPATRRSFVTRPRESARIASRAVGTAATGRLGREEAVQQFAPYSKMAVLMTTLGASRGPWLRVGGVRRLGVSARVCSGMPVGKPLHKHEPPTSEVRTHPSHPPSRPRCPVFVAAPHSKSLHLPHRRLCFHHKCRIHS